VFGYSGLRLSSREASQYDTVTALLPPRSRCPWDVDDHEGVTITDATPRRRRHGHSDRARRVRLDRLP
jgi:hypothetical protein